ncbi:hydrolase [Catenovulum sediminis]|uniref:Hydrolase n=1 Tax=Catenovulum sediminis TaxID=1740262 RepID=A0ABV1RBY6_9ALTE
MIIESRFKPAWWLKNRHFQTGWQKIERKNLPCPTLSERIELPDQDFLDIHWTEKPNFDTTKPIVVVLHGLEGSIKSAYARGMLNAIRRKGWIGLLLHFRSCGGVPNRLPRAYHSGETTDLAYLCQWLKERYAHAPLACISFSLGANVLCKFAGESGQQNPFEAGVAICPPLDLAACCRHIQKGTSKVYQKYLLDMMLDNLARKMQRVNLNNHIKLKADEFRKIKTLWQFDDLVTAPLHGFFNAADYYQKSSGRQFLRHIEKPTLIIHSNDDPFLSPKSIPQRDELSHRVTFEMSEKGGHVGYVSGSIPFKGEYWLEKRSINYIENHLQYR